MQTFDCPFLISRALKRMKMGHKVAEFVVIKHFSTFLRLGGGCLLKVFSSHHINLICTRQVFCFQTLAKRQKTFFMMTHSSWEEEWAGGERPIIKWLALSTKWWYHTQCDQIGRLIGLCATF